MAPNLLREYREAIPDRMFNEYEHKVIPVFLTEKSALKLIFSVLIRAAKRKQGKRFDVLKVARLDKLRSSLGLEVNQIKEVS